MKKYVIYLISSFALISSLSGCIRREVYCRNLSCIPDPPKLMKDKERDLRKLIDYAADISIIKKNVKENSK